MDRPELLDACMVSCKYSLVESVAICAFEPFANQELVQKYYIALAQSGQVRLWLTTVNQADVVHVPAHSFYIHHHGLLFALACFKPEDYS